MVQFRYPSAAVHRSLVWLVDRTPSLADRRDSGVDQEPRGLSPTRDLTVVAPRRSQSRLPSPAACVLHILRKLEGFYVNRHPREPRVVNATGLC